MAKEQDIKAAGFEAVVRAIGTTLDSIEPPISFVAIVALDGTELSSQASNLPLHEALAMLEQHVELLKHAIREVDAQMSPKPKA